MGFDKLSSWEKLNAATSALEAMDSVFENSEERQRVLDAIHAQTQENLDVKSAMDAADAVTSILANTGLAGLRDKLKALPWLTGVFS